MRGTIILLVLLLTAIAFAAENTPQPQTGSQSTAEEELKPADIEPSSNAAAGNELILADIDSPEDEQSNSRFIPTEEISQDLGVSFPVDI